ncbi:MAG: AI-2E family transporter [Sphingomonadales bacterium]|nr:AI-2E family transporter [Sphingomonadales bacterium]
MVAVILLGLAGLWTLLPFLAAAGWAAVFAVSLWPWYARCQARWPKQGRALLPLGVTLLILLIFVLPLIMVATALAHDSATFAEWVRQSGAEGIPPPDLLGHLPYGDQLIGWWQANLAQPGALSRLSILHREGGLSSLDLGGRFLGAVLHRLLIIVFMLLIFFFLLRDGESLARGLRVGSARAFGPAGEHVGEQIVQAIRGTVNGLVVVGLGEGVLMGAAYYIAGVPHPAILGLLTGLLSAIPLGAVIAYVAAAGLLAAGGEIGAAIAIAVLGSVVVFVADHFIRPVLIGGATRLPFLLVLLGIIGGIEAWGLIGIVLGPALMAALLLLWREWIGTQRGPLNPAVPDERMPQIGG